jgi:hypothetical protein
LPDATSLPQNPFSSTLKAADRRGSQVLAENGFIYLKILSAEDQGCGVVVKEGRGPVRVHDSFDEEIAPCKKFLMNALLERLQHQGYVAQQAYADQKGRSPRDFLQRGK